MRVGIFLIAIRELGERERIGICGVCVPGSRRRSFLFFDGIEPRDFFPGRLRPNSLHLASQWCVHSLVVSWDMNAVFSSWVF
jgi:hypothetical protein